MTHFKIVNTDNFGGDYPDEKFVEGLPFPLNKALATRLCKAFNDAAEVISYGSNHPRFWKVVPEDYVLQPGFEP